MASIDLKTLFKNTEDVDQKIFLALLKALKEKHQEGFDYLRFKQSVSNLKEMAMDEETSIKSAFVTATTMGITKIKLANSVKHYMLILKKERESFAEALRNQMATKVEAKRIEAEKLAKKIDEYKTKIAKMEEEMALYQQKIDSVDEDMESARTKIEETRDKFEKTYNVISDIMEKDKSTIEAIL